ncbi:MAG: glycoside hydrolase family 3 protein [Erysipelotrichaceae bacterium]|nr:glycoside hydrolase family 3 protein [Erysipelotrichaceae bacterium]
MMDIEKIIQEMTLEEKIAFCTGKDMWHTKEYPAHGIESIMMTDGPHGLRCQKNTQDNLGLNESLPATCFPTAVTSCATWDPELLRQEGEAIAEEAREYGVSIVLGPGANIKRNPLGGRNFEYMSEDPVLAGRMAASFIRGAENRGVGTSLKHFACNNQEYKRQNGNSIVDERALREIYLKPFEIAVKESHPSTVMCSYNQINGTYSSDNRKLLTDILRDEWGFDGLVMTDWGAMADRIKGFKAGCDLNMPGGSAYMENKVLKAVKDGSLDERFINESVRRLLRLIDRKVEEHPGEADWKKHQELALKIAREGAVLLKNEGVLPLNKKDIGIIGHMAKELRYQGSGSSHINPTELQQITDIWSDVPYTEGVDNMGNITNLNEAVKLAENVSTAVLFLGLPEAYESEAFDREHMNLPQGHNTLIDEICKVNENVVVVLYGGSAMHIPWADKVKGILYMGLPGQSGTQATIDVLEGTYEPSGRLAESWPLGYDDVVSRETFGHRNPEYRESIYVGYRYYDKAGMKVRYPFGYGLSYTDFTYGNMKLTDDTVSVDITNSGKRRGSETVQLYVSPEDQLFRCVRELKEFRKVCLEPGETVTVSFKITDSFFEVYKNGFRKAGGNYRIEIGSNSRNIATSLDYAVEGETGLFEEYKGSWYDTVRGLPARSDLEKLLGSRIKDNEEPRKGSFTLDNSCLEMKDSSLVMRIEYLVTKAIISKPFAKEERTLDNPSYKMMLTAATDCPLRATIISSNGSMNDNVAEGLIEMANGHFIRGIGKMMGKN